MTVGFAATSPCWRRSSGCGCRSTGTGCRFRRRIKWCWSWSFLPALTQTGRVWSLDARRRGRLADHGTVPIWPLRLIRCQVSLIYLELRAVEAALPGVAGRLSRLLGAEHQRLSPVSVAASRRGRTAGRRADAGHAPLRAAVSRAGLVSGHPPAAPWLLGIGLHLGLWLTLELGPFSWVMIASYIAFLDPARVAARVVRRGAPKNPRRPSQFHCVSARSFHVRSSAVREHFRRYSARGCKDGAGIAAARAAPPRGKSSSLQFVNQAASAVVVRGALALHFGSWQSRPPPGALPRGIWPGES